MRVTRKAKLEAIEAFDAAAQEYAFRGSYSGSPRYDEVCREYHVAKADLINKALSQNSRG